MLLFSALPCLAGQQQAGTPTFRVNARAVLVDVVVTDSRGNPVTGLQKSAFHVFDNGRPQTINAFDVHSGAFQRGSEQTASQGSEPSNTSTGASPVRNVLLIDTSRMDVLVQMSLYKQFLRFVHDLPPNLPVAVFLRGYAAPVMLQNFTTDRALLNAAIAKAIPHLQKFKAGLSQPEAGDYIGPQRVADYLSQVPGRKNLLWFLGGIEANGPLALANAGISPGAGPENQDLRRTYDLLQKARVSIYPIDVRGLEPAGDVTLPDQHLREVAYAEDTGGKAFYNMNDVKTAADSALDNGENFYTLTYSPDDLRGNGSWHTLHVTVDGGKYQLSYRQGYYDDASPGSGKAAVNRTAMVAVKNSEIAQPDARSAPLFFRVQAALDKYPSRPPRRGRRIWKVHYDVPASELEQAFTDGIGRAQAGAAVLAFNQDGRVVGQISQEVTLKFEEAAFKAAPNAALSFDQLIDLPESGDTFLYVALWDAKTGRMGTVDMTVNPRKHKAK